MAAMTAIAANTHTNTHIHTYTCLPSNFSFCFLYAVWDTWKTGKLHTPSKGLHLRFELSTTNSSKASHQAIPFWRVRAARVTQACANDARLSVLPLTQPICTWTHSVRRQCCHSPNEFAPGSTNNTAPCINTKSYTRPTNCSVYFTCKNTHRVQSSRSNCLQKTSMHTISVHQSGPTDRNSWAPITCA